MTSSKVLFYLCVSFVIGIAVASIFKIPQMLVWGVFVFGMLVIAGFLLVPQNRRPSVLWDFQNGALVFGFCMLMLVLGMMRLQISQFTIENDPLRQRNDKPEKTTFIGQIIDEPDVRDLSEKLKVTIKNSTVLVTTGRGEYQYLDTIKITGKLKTPAEFQDFNYKHYLLKDGIYSVMDYPKIELVSTSHRYTPITFAYEKVVWLKEQLRKSVYENFSPPQSQLLEGIVLGNNKTMTQDLRDQLNASGLRYLTAISGVHVIIVSEMLMILFLFLGLWRGQAFYFSIAFIWFYIIITGFTASGIRAAIMGIIFLLAQKLGRQNTSSRTIVIAATLMLLQNPMLLFYDIGFQLSFMASVGIIYGKPLLEIGMKVFTKEHARPLVEAMAVTLAAQAFIAPIMIYNFGNISLVAPITSLLVLPIMPWILVSGFLAAFVGIFSGILGWIFSVPCWFLLMYFIKILEIFSGPWAIKTITNASWMWLVAYYVVLFVVVRYLQKYQKQNFLGY